VYTGVVCILFHSLGRIYLLFYFLILCYGNVNLNNAHLSKLIKGQKTEQVEKDASAKMFWASGSGAGTDFC